MRGHGWGNVLSGFKLHTRGSNKSSSRGKTIIWVKLKERLVVIDVRWWVHDKPMSPTRYMSPKQVSKLQARISTDLEMGPQSIMSSNYVTDRIH